MTEEPREEKSREIGEAAERYLLNRWQFHATIFLATLPHLLAAAAFALLLNLAATLSIGAGPFSDANPVILWAVAGVLVVALAIYAVSQGPLFRWAMLLMQRRPVIVRAAVPASSVRYQWLWLVPAPLPALGGYLLGDAFWGLLARAQPLAVMLSLTAYMALLAVIGRITSGKWRLLRGPSALVVSAALTVGALGISLGVPVPAVFLLPEAAGLRLLGPMVVFFLVWFLASGVYGQIQFRRLQRLVNEDPPRERNGDD